MTYAELSDAVVNDPTGATAGDEPVAVWTGKTGPIGRIVYVNGNAAIAIYVENDTLTPEQAERIAAFLVAHGPAIARGERE